MCKHYISSLCPCKEGKLIEYTQRTRIRFISKEDFSSVKLEVSICAMNTLLYYVILFIVSLHIASLFFITANKINAEFSFVMTCDIYMASCLLSA